MAPRPPVHSRLTAHRADAQANLALMRATNADIHRIIQNTWKLISDGQETIRRLDGLLHALPGSGEA